MSKFVIYSSKDKDLKNLGRRNRRLFWYVFIVFPLAGLIIPIAKNYLSKDLRNIILISDFVLIIILILMTIYYSRRLKKIGEIAFNKKGAIKKIGDYNEIWDADSIEKISIYKHMREIFSQANAERIKSFLMIAVFKDGSTQRFVLGSQSIDKPEYPLKDLLKIWSKINKVNAEIK